MQVAHSKSPLKEPPSAVYRERGEDFDPSETAAGGANPLPNQMLQSLAFLIYELNKFACTQTFDNAMECKSQIDAALSVW